MKLSEPWVCRQADHRWGCGVDIRSRAATGISWSPLSGLKGVKPPVKFGEKTRDCSPGQAGKAGEDQTKEHTQRHDNVGYVGDNQGSVNHRLQSTCSLFINENTLRRGARKEYSLDY